MSSLFERMGSRFPLVVEATRSARAAPIPSLVTALVAIAVAMVVLLTTGRTVGASQAVLARIDDAEPRIITITDTEGDAGLDPTVVDRIRLMSGVSEVVALSKGSEAINPKLTRRDPVGLYTAWGDLPQEWSMSVGRTPNEGEVVIDEGAMELLGIGDGIGEVGTDNLTWPVVGTFATEGVFAGFDFSALRKGSIATAQDGQQAPQDTPQDMQVLYVRVLAASTDDVAAIADDIDKVLSVDDMTSLRIATSGDFAELRKAISGDLGRFGRGLVLMVLASGMLLGMLNTSALILMRRRDLGRRRALGATRGLLVKLLVLQSTLPSVLGAFFGCIGGAAILDASGDPLPELPFYLALVFLTVLASALAALGPSISAAWRDPIKVLRQP